MSRSVYCMRCTGIVRCFRTVEVPGTQPFGAWLIPDLHASTIRPQHCPGGVR